MSEFNFGKKAAQQFSIKNKMLDAIAERLNIPRAINQRKARAMVVNAIKTHDVRNKADQAEVCEILRQLKAGGPTRWTQLSPWLAGEKDWGKN